MAGGWSRDGAVQDQIDASVADAVRAARERLAAQGGHAVARERCAECDETIPEARRAAIPGVRLCVPCQEAVDRERASDGPFNRRGSKDSQLR